MSVLLAVNRAIRRAYCEMGVFGVTGTVTIALDENHWRQFMIEARSATSSNQRFIGPRPNAITEHEVILLGARVVRRDPDDPDPLDIRPRFTLDVG